MLSISSMLCDEEDIHGQFPTALTVGALKEHESLTSLSIELPCRTHSRRGSRRGSWRGSRCGSRRGSWRGSRRGSRYGSGRSSASSTCGPLLLPI